ncbi:enoyl-CoA hydratase/isomerase family protein [Neobacillus sp. NRS-1170]|uniref:enoyl-CoA hydratase/isomerase family protein n=1 Tax=Neobacillus sp. NRS-1170 TaxID=3233898 RepID=UPI003D2C22C1
MCYQYILTAKEDDIGILTINQPSKRNMLNLDALKEMEHALEAFKEDREVKVVIITGAGDKSFASGADIGELNKRTMLDALQPNMTATYQKIENYDKPIIAAINGIAVGGGLELALSCDVRIAVKEAILGLPELNLGIIPGAGGTQRLTRILGKGKAMELILTGDLLTGEEAERFGLVAKAVEREELMAIAKSFAARIASKSPLALKIAKMVVNKGADIEMDTALMIEKLGQALLMGSDDKNEGTRAFLEKRTAMFQGK